MMAYQSCIDWCHNHPALLTIFLLFSVVFPFALYATTRNATNDATEPSSTASATFLSDVEKQQSQADPYQIRERRPVWLRLAAMLRLSYRNEDCKDNLDLEDDVEPQEKTPLIGSMPSDQGCRRGGQLANNWHGTNQLNTSWSYMA